MISSVFCDGKSLGVLFLIVTCVGFLRGCAIRRRVLLPSTRVIISLVFAGIYNSRAERKTRSFHLVYRRIKSEI